MIDSDLRDDLLDRLRDIPGHLRVLTDGAGDERLRRAGPGGGWGVVEIVCHLRDWDIVFRERIERLLHEDVPRFAAVDDSLWPIERGYHRQDPRAVLEAFAAGRARIVEMLDALAPADWQRQAIHYAAGRRPLGWFVEDIAEHDAEHAAQAAVVLA